MARTGAIERWDLLDVFRGALKSAGEAFDRECACDLPDEHKHWHLALLLLGTNY